jgi:hypothetical protein
MLHCRQKEAKACRVVVELSQNGEITEPTVLGICLDDSDNYQIRLPIVPLAPEVHLEEMHAHIIAMDAKHVRVEIELPCEPTQITVDPDSVLLDCHPENNCWQPRINWRVTPLYFLLDETDLTNPYDRWSVIFGPWLYGPTYGNPWYTLSSMAGVRAGVYRTQEFSAGAYVAYRSDYRDVAEGVDALLDHWPFPNTQVGFNFERSLTTFSNDAQNSRGVIYGRYVINYSSSLYLPPFEYAEVFAAITDNNLPPPSVATPGANHFDHQSLLGVHFHRDYRTPYWNPEGGYALDVTGVAGLPALDEAQSFQALYAQLSAVQNLGALDKLGLHWLSDTRLAARLYGAAAVPENAQVFSLGGNMLFRGFDLSQRQGNVVWIASVEWRFPIIKGVEWDCCDHIAGIRNIEGVLFYDTGNAYLQGQAEGPIAQAVGAGLRVDIAWFSLIERTTVRFDVATAINCNVPIQFWFGLAHAF